MRQQLDEHEGLRRIQRAHIVQEDAIGRNEVVLDLGKV